MTPTSWSYRFFVGKIPHLKYFHKEICFRKKKQKRSGGNPYFFPNFCFYSHSFCSLIKEKE